MVVLSSIIHLQLPACWFCPLLVEALAVSNYNSGLVCFSFQCSQVLPYIFSPSVVRHIHVYICWRVGQPRKGRHSRERQQEEQRSKSVAGQAQGVGNKGSEGQTSWANPARGVLAFPFLGGTWSCAGGSDHWVVRLA